MKSVLRKEKGTTSGKVLDRRGGRWEGEGVGLNGTVMSDRGGVWAVKRPSVYLGIISLWNKE